jgi:hypothetical protein
MKDKRIKKKISKRKASDDINLSEPDEMKIEIENSANNNNSSSNSNNIINNNTNQLNISNIPQANSNPNPISTEKTNKLDFKAGNYNLEGAKGHVNFYSINPIQSGTFYFEVKIKTLDFNVSEWVSLKRTDDFSKKYYENILTNQKGFSPNIRIGLSHYKCDLEIPVGSDQNSYCYRVKDGALITEGDVKGNNFACGNNDVVGVLFKMKPPMPEFLKAKMLENDDQNLFNNECYIKFFVNGKEQQCNFIGLHEGDYHVVITLYNFSQAEIDFGNNLAYFSSVSQGVDVIPLKELRI